MKTKTIIPFLSMLLLVLFIGCDSSDNDNNEEAIAEEEVAEIVASSVASETAGVVIDIETTVEITVESTDTTTDPTNCGASLDTTITRSQSSSLITHQYSANYSYELDCDSTNNPTSLAVAFSYNGEFDAPRVASQNTGSGEFMITQIENTSDMYVINGLWNRSGSFQSKIRNKASRSVSVQFALVDVAVGKEPRDIDSGTIAFSLEGEGSSGNGEGSFSYEGTITFNGDGQMIIEFEGSRYIASTTTGEVEEG